MRSMNRLRDMQQRRELKFDRKYQDRLMATPIPVSMVDVNRNGSEKLLAMILKNRGLRLPPPLPVSLAN